MQNESAANNSLWAWAATVVVAAVLFAAPAAGQDDYKLELVDRLGSPFWFERDEAAHELAKIITESEAIRLYDSDPERFWVLSSAGIPEGARLESRLMSSAEPGRAADALFTSDRVHLLEGGNEPVRNAYRDLWFESWIADGHFDIADGKLIRHICDRPWLRSRFLASPLWTRSTVTHTVREIRRIIRVMTGEGDAASGSRWLDMLHRCKATGVNHMENAEMTCGAGEWDGLAEQHYSQMFGRVAYAEIICLVLDKPDWVPAVQERLARATRAWISWAMERPERKLATEDRRTPMVRMAHLSATMRIDTLIAEAEQAILAGRQRFMLKDTIECHEWFDIALHDKKFASWYSEFVKPGKLVSRDSVKIKRFSA